MQMQAAPEQAPISLDSSLFWMRPKAHEEPMQCHAMQSVRFKSRDLPGATIALRCCHKLREEALQRGCPGVVPCNPISNATTQRAANERMMWSGSNETRYVPYGRYIACHVRHLG